MSSSVGSFTGGTTVSQHGTLRMTKIEVKEGGEHAYSAKYSPDGKLFGVTFGNGVCRLFDADSLLPLQRMKALPQHDDMPSTSIKWRGAPVGDSYDFASCTSGGAVYGWHWESGDSGFVERSWKAMEDGNETASIDYSPDGRVLVSVGSDRKVRVYDVETKRSWKAMEDGNETASIDYSPDGRVLVSVGSDRKVRVYDVETKKLVEVMEKGHDETGHTRAAHTNRIFSAKFASQTTLLTGGWANPVQVWDMRTKRAERQLSGPSIGSDSIEPLEGTSKVLISSTRKENQLQVFDYISGNEVQAESQKLCKSLSGMQLYGARYLKESQSIFAITCKPDTILHIDAVTGDVNGLIEEIGVPLHSCDVVPIRPKTCLFSGAKETILIVETA